ncbi:MAG: site-2 protease family protein [Planctomycetaceae bacterium]|nr:site-2 protease family protein [Planctomycetaceae bacterium]
MFMLNRSIKLFTILGFTVRIDLSWLVILVLVVWSLGAGVFPAQFPGLAWGSYLAMALAAALGLFASIVIHELCHSLVARAYGLPMKGITLFMLGGVAEMSDEPPTPKAEGLIAAAGPAISLVLGVVFIVAAIGAAAVGWPNEVVGVLQWVGLINIILLVFNMIPGFPLDGGRILRAVLWAIKKDLRWATHVASRVGMGFGIVLVGLGILELLLGGNVIGGVWWIVIGLFVRSAAKQGYQQILVREMLHGEPLNRFMNTEPVTVPTSLNLKDLVEDKVFQYHFKMFPVVEDGQLTGCVTTQKVREVPREQWPMKTVGEIMQPCSDENSIPPNEDAMHALTRMTQAQASRLMVVDHGTLVGIITLRDLLKFLSSKMALESDEEIRKVEPPEE